MTTYTLQDLTEHLEGMADSLDEHVNHQDIHRLLTEARDLAQRLTTTPTTTEWTLRGPDGELIKRSFTEDEARTAAEGSKHWTAVRREVTEWTEDDR